MSDDRGEKHSGTDRGLPDRDRLLEGLHGLPIADGVGPEVLREAVDLAAVVRYPAGTPVIHQGGAVRTAYLVSRGCIAVICLSRQGHLRATEVLSEGDLLGFELLSHATASGYTALTLTEIELLAFSRNAVLQLLSRCQPGGLPILAHLIERHAAVSTTAVECVGASLRCRTAKALLLLSQRMGARTLPVTQELLAALAWGSREAVASVLGEFRSNHWVRTRRGRIEILDLQALTTLTAG